jgi:hypothetical protein
MNKNNVTTITPLTVQTGNSNKINGNNNNNTYEPSRHIHQLQSKSKFSITNGSPAGSPIGSPVMKVEGLGEKNHLITNVVTTEFQQQNINSLNNSRTS